MYTVEVKWSHLISTAARGGCLYPAPNLNTRQSSHCSKVSESEPSGLGSTTICSSPVRANGEDEHELTSSHRIEERKNKNGNKIHIEIRKKGEQKWTNRWQPCFTAGRSGPFPPAQPSPERETFSLRSPSQGAPALGEEQATRTHTHYTRIQALITCPTCSCTSQPTAPPDLHHFGLTGVQHSTPWRSTTCSIFPCLLPNPSTTWSTIKPN